MPRACGFAIAWRARSAARDIRFGSHPDIVVAEQRAIASPDAGEGDVLDQRLEGSRDFSNVSVAVGGK